MNLYILSNLLDHLKELGFTLASASLFIFLLDQSSIKTCSPHRSKIFIYTYTMCDLLVKDRYTLKTHPLNALLKEARYLALPNGMHQFARRMMRRHQFHAVDEAIQFLAKKHNVAALPNGALGLQSQARQRKLVEPVLEDEYDHAHQHAHAQQQEHAGHRLNACAVAL